jgi:hypothetical protein
VVVAEDLGEFILQILAEAEPEVADNLQAAPTEELLNNRAKLTQAVLNTDIREHLAECLEEVVVQDRMHNTNQEQANGLLVAVAERDQPEVIGLIEMM